MTAAGPTRTIAHFRVLLSADLAVRVLVFGTAIVAARVLGPTEFGFVSIAVAAVSYAGVLGDGGLTTLAQLRLMRDGSQGERVVAATVAVQLVLAVVAALLLSALVYLLPFRHEVRLLTLSALPLLLAQALSTLYVLQAEERMSAVAGLRLLSQVVTTCVCIGALAVGFSGSSVTTSQWAGVLGADLVAAFLLRRHRWRPTGLTRAFALDLARQAAPYLLAMISTQLIINADTVVLGLSRPAAEVGQYGVAFRLAAACLSLVGVVMAAAFPELVRRLAAGPGGAAPLITRLVRTTCRPGFAAAALVCLAAPAIVSTVYGSSYHRSADYLAILFLLVPLGFHNTILAQSLLAAGRQDAYLRAVGGTALLTVAALLLTVPVWGAPAAAIVTVLAEVASAAMLTLLVREPLAVKALPVLLAQLPFLVVPLAVGGLGDWLLDATPWEAAGLGAVAIACCEGLSRTHLLPELRDIVSLRG
jgi:O-antigen/teichoic acid export membrane protein